MITLKDIRKKKGFLASKIAEHLNISYRQYHRIEIGSAKLDKAKAHKLSKIYDIDVAKIEEAWEKGSEEFEKNN